MLGTAVMVGGPRWVGPHPGRASALWSISHCLHYFPVLACWWEHTEGLQPSLLGLRVLVVHHKDPVSSCQIVC